MKTEIKSLSTIKPLTKLELSEMLYRAMKPATTEFEAKIIDKTIKRFAELPDIKFKKQFEKSSKLQIKIFAPGMFYITY